MACGLGQLLLPFLCRARRAAPGMWAKGISTTSNAWSPRALRMASGHACHHGGTSPALATEPAGRAGGGVKNAAFDAGFPGTGLDAEVPYWRACVDMMHETVKDPLACISASNSTPTHWSCAQPPASAGRRSRARAPVPRALVSCERVPQ